MCTLSLTTPPLSPLVEVYVQDLHTAFSMYTVSFTVSPLSPLVEVYVRVVHTPYFLCAHQLSTPFVPASLGRPILGASWAQSWRFSNKMIDLHFRSKKMTKKIHVDAFVSLLLHISEGIYHRQFVKFAWLSMFRSWAKIWLFLANKTFQKLIFKNIHVT